MTLVHFVVSFTVGFNCPLPLIIFTMEGHQYKCQYSFSPYEPHWRALHHNKSRIQRGSICASIGSLARAQDDDSTHTLD